MRKIIPLSLIAVASIYAAEVELAPINIESTVITEVSQKAQTSADLADALSKNVPSIDMNRRSGIANDIYIRGQKRDNISVEVDGTKVCGACPNRMDPPSSHILASQIDDIEVIEGPYDVETFGTMSGGIKITTKKPTKQINAELNLGFGSWGYKKFGATFSGGNDFIRVLVSGSTESSEQYEDGNGDSLAQQLEKYPAAGTSVYSDTYRDMDAYTKKSIMTKAFINITDDQELRLSYTGNRSEDVLYPSTPMDAQYDYSNIYSIEYNIANLTDTYKSINLQYYYSDVDHPMDFKYREKRMMGKYKTNQLQTMMQGLKIKNNLEIEGTKVLVGLDASRRMWQGQSYMTADATGIQSAFAESLAHTETDNKAVFTKVEKSFGALDIEVGARYDSTDITPTNSTAISYYKKDYNALNAHMLASYNLSKTNKVFLGFGKSSRVPDARELYIPGSGNQYLDQTTNKEIDLGYELKNDTMNFKIKTFYSDLDDYIYLQKGSTFKNIDAKVYGAELSSEFFVTDNLTIDAGASYKRGKKDHALSVTNTDTDLADIAPLRGNVGLSYEYANNSVASVEAIFSDNWSKFDSSNGEQAIGGWTTLNMKVKHALNKQFDFTLGVNNLLDKTYAQSNTYVDITLLTSGATETMLLNEPGRYVYTNIDFRF